MHQNSLVRQIGFQHSSPRESNSNWQRLFVHLKNGDVLEFVALLLSNVNLATGEFVNDLITAEKLSRLLHRDACRECRLPLWTCGRDESCGSVDLLRKQEGIDSAVVIGAREASAVS